MAGCVLVRKRIYFFLICVILWQLAVAGKVLYLKVFQAEHYRVLNRNQKVNILRVPATRGKILDCHLEPLAASVPFDSIYIYTPHIDHKDQTARILARTLQMDFQQIRMKMDGNLKFRFIKRFATQPEAAAVRADVRKFNLKGIGFLAESRRVYPNGDLAAHALGTVSLQDGTEKGIEGIEKRYDRQLCGSPGDIFLQRDGRQKVLSTMELTPPQTGQTLILNIDSQVQLITQRELEAGRIRFNAVSGIAIVMEPGTGRIQALAVSPGYNPGDLSQTPAANLRNQAIERIFEPGSTFKIVAASGALEENLVSPDEIIYCGNGFITLSGHIIRDHKAFQNLSFGEIIANSSDVGAIKLGLRLGETNLYRYIRTFGFGARTEIDLPSEDRGMLSSPARWSGLSIGSISMGQEIGVTAVQILRAMAAIVNGGYLVRPLIANRILDEDGRLAEVIPADRVRILSPRTADVIREALCQVVDDGTGGRASIPGYRVGGKTGTAQKFDRERGCYSPNEFVASFIGFAPAEAPRFIVAVIYDSPHPFYHGGEVSAPVFREIARQVLLLKHIQPTAVVPNQQLAALHPAPPAPPAPELTPPVDSLLIQEGGPRETVISLIPEGSFTMPDFTGKSMRLVMKECASLRLILQPSGSGAAFYQEPPAGAMIKPESRCTVRFSSEPAPAPGRPVAAENPAVQPETPPLPASARTLSANQEKPAGGRP